MVSETVCSTQWFTKTVYSQDVNFFKTGPQKQQPEKIRIRRINRAFHVL